MELASVELLCKCFHEISEKVQKQEKYLNVNIQRPYLYLVRFIL